jgi:hypothetical protein
MEFNLAADCNKLEHKRDYLSHVGRVTGIHLGLSISVDIKGLIFIFFSFRKGKSFERFKRQDVPMGRCS